MSNCEDVELENLRKAALQSMQSKASAKPAIINYVKSVSNFSNINNNSNNVQIQIERPDRNFVANKKARKAFPKNHSQQFNQQNQFHSQFNQQQFNKPQPPPQNYASNPTGFTNDLQQYFNQFNNDHQFNNLPQKFNKQFNSSQQPPQFSNLPSLTPQQYKNHPAQFQPPQFNPTPQQFNQPRSNLIVLTAENSSKGPMNDSMPNYSHHQMNQQHFRNGYNQPMNRQTNKKFQNKQFHPNKLNEIKLKDVPTDANKNADSLPSRFSRIDRDSSSDEESDSEDNEIEKYRQTYFVANGEDTQNTEKQIKMLKDESNEKNDECLIRSDENLEIDSNANEETVEEEHINASSEVELNKQKEDRSNGEDQLDSSQVSSVDSFESFDKMILRNKKRLSDLDREVDVKRLTRESDKSISVKGDETTSDQIEQKEQRAEFSQEGTTENPKVESSQEDMTTKVREPARKKKIVFNKEDFEDSTNDDSRITRRTTRRLSSIIECNRGDQRQSPDPPSNLQRLKSRVKVVNKSSIIRLISSNSSNCEEPDYSRGSSKTLRSLVVKK